MLVAVPEMVLAELAGGVAQGLEQPGDGGVVGTEPDRRPRDTDLAQPGAIDALR
jgi:hypothetical protein